MAMSITPMWRVDRDESMFINKKEAEEHDKMLELADNLSSILESNFTIDEKLAENIGLFLSRHKDTLAKAFKGKPDLILNINKEQQETNDKELTSVETTSKPVAA